MAPSRVSSFMPTTAVTDHAGGVDDMDESGPPDGFEVVEVTDIPSYSRRQFPGPLPTDEVFKLAQLEGSPSRGLEASLAGLRQRHASANHRLQAQLGKEAAKWLGEVEFCLLNTEDRQLVSDLRAYGAGISEWPRPGTPDTAKDAFTAVEPQLRAARLMRPAMKMAFAALARWETMHGLDDRMNARAAGADALRRAVMTKTDDGVLYIEVDERHAQPSGVELPSAEVLDSLGVTVSTVLLQASAGSAGGGGNPVASSALAMAKRAPRGLWQIVCVPPLSPADVGNALPPGWSLDNVGLRRDILPCPDAALKFFLPSQGDLVARWWSQMQDRPAAGAMSGFLSSLHQQLEDLANLPNGPALHQEASARIGRLVRRLTDEPELLDALHSELDVEAPCVDAQMKLLCLIDLMVGTRTDVDSHEVPGALLRMALMKAADRYVGLHDDGKENLERGLAMHSLIDFRLAQITGKRFPHTPRPHFRGLARMSGPRRAFFGKGEAKPAEKDWSVQMREAANTILRKQVENNFPDVRAWLSAPEGPIQRLTDRMLADPHYQQIKAKWEAKFLAAEERAEAADATPEDRRHYDEVQAQMPVVLADAQLDLMKDWLDPLRKAFRRRGRS